MEQQNDNEQTEVKFYKGTLLDVVVTNQADPQTIERLTNPKYQQEVCQEAVAWTEEHYRETFEQLKNL